jgi:hypothetical protein
VCRVNVYVNERTVEILGDEHLENDEPRFALFVPLELPSAFVLLSNLLFFGLLLFLPKGLY